MRPAVLATTLVLALLVFGLWMPSGFAPPGLPSITVAVEEVGEVVSDPVDFNHVHTTGTVTVENFPLGATVNVNATTDSFWMVTVSPTTIEVSGQTGTTETVNLDIRVPPKASAEQEVELIFYANTTTTLGLEYEDEDRTNITIKQFYGLRVTSNGTMSIDQGKNLTHRMRVTNSGNGNDDLNVALTNEATMTAAGLEFSFEPTVLGVGPNRMTSILVRLTAADNADVGTVEAQFTITSQGDATKAVNYRITIPINKSTSSNGGNGNGDDGDGDDGGLLPGFGTVTAILVISMMAIGLASRRVPRRAR
jgi:hypothetical protein